MARIEAGIYTPRLVREAARRGWEGFQFLAGVPGTTVSAPGVSVIVAFWAVPVYAVSAPSLSITFPLKV